MEANEPHFNSNQLLAIIRSRPEGFTEYELLNCLYESYFKGPKPDLSDSLVLFQQHFCLFHALYRLQDQLYLQNAGRLTINALSIQWLAPTQDALTSQPLTTGDDKLRDYYLDINNLKATDRSQVENLLTGFWLKFVDNGDKRAALATLGLTEPTTLAAIKKQYRQQLSACHPDRGGSHEQAQLLNEAMAVLKRCYA